MKDGSTLYTILPHDKLIKKLYNVIDLFLMVDIEHTFVFSEVMCMLGKYPKDIVAISKSTLKYFFRTCYTKLLFYG